MTIVPVYNMAVVPNADLYLQTDNYTRMAGKKPEEGERVFFLVLKEETIKRSGKFGPLVGGILGAFFIYREA